MFFLQARGPPYFAVFYYHNGKQLLSLQREYSWVEKQEDDKNIEEKNIIYSQEVSSCMTTSRLSHKYERKDQFLWFLQKKIK